MVQSLSRKLPKVDISRINVQQFIRLERKSSLFVAVVGFFIVLNLLVSRTSVRLDFSQGRAYTLSPSTIKILKDLDDVVQIKVFISDDLPLRLVPLRVDIMDLVGEYRRVGGGKVAVTVTDPKGDEKAQREVRERGIPELQLSQIERDKYEVSSAYLGIAVLYGDKHVTIPQATNLASLEFDLTSSIYKMTRGAPPQVGLIGIQNIADPRADQYFSLKRVLAQQFDLVFVDVATDSAGFAIDPAVSTLVLADNGATQFTTEQKDSLTDFIARGGRVVFMVDGVYVQDGLVTQEATHNLFDFFDLWGVSLHRNLLLSQSSELANFSTGSVSFFTPYPFWVKTTSFNEESALFSNIRALVFPWVSSIGTTKRGDSETTVLVQTEENSWAQSEPFVLDPTNIPPPQDTLKSYGLIAEVSQKVGGGFVLIPTSRFVREQFLSESAGNLEFVVNLVSTFASEGALSGIRARAISFAPLREIPDRSKDLVKFAMVLLLPGAFGGFGAYRLIKRR